MQLKVLLFSIFIIYPFNNLKAQNTEALIDSQQFLSPASALIQSAIIPGLGQVYQERLWTATFFYSIGATFYYRTAYHFNRYKSTDNKKYLNKAKADLSIAIFNHILNIIDAYDTGYNTNPRGWDGALFSDKPLKSPWGATLRSAIFPGWGQLYNEEYVKAFVFAGLVGFVAYQIDWNTRKHEQTGKLKYEDDRSRYSWYMGLTYLVMLTDAHVDAHLFKFNEAVKLAIIPGSSPDSFSLSLSIKF